MSAIWIVSLSDGQRLSSKDLLTGDGKNPWTKVLQYLQKNKVNANNTKKKITHIELVVNGVRYNGPSTSPNSSFASSEEVRNFWIFYKASAHIMGNKSAENYLAHSYRCGDFRHIFWVHEKNNFCYAQTLDIKNPKSETERHFSAIEKTIDREYSNL